MNRRAEIRATEKKRRKEETTRERGVEEEINGAGREYRKILRGKGKKKRRQKKNMFVC